MAKSVARSVPSRRGRSSAKSRKSQLSARIVSSTLAKLEEQARRTGQSRSGLVQRYVEEGLRMDAHPGVVFVDGPAGRRPVLRRRPGLDIWEIIETVQVNRSPKDAAEYLHLTEQDIEVALAYYAVYRDEIDAWIRDNREMAEREEAAWRRMRAAGR